MNWRTLMDDTPIVDHPNPDETSDIFIPTQGFLKFVDGKLHQYQWSYEDRRFAWYLIEGQ